MHGDAGVLPLTESSRRTDWPRPKLTQNLSFAFAVDQVIYSVPSGWPLLSPLPRRVPARSG